MPRAHRGSEQVTLKLNDKEESSVRGKLLQIMEKEDVALETEVRSRSVPGRLPSIPKKGGPMMP